MPSKWWCVNINVSNWTELEASHVRGNLSTQRVESPHNKIRVNRVRGNASTQLVESPHNKIGVNQVRGNASTQLVESPHDKIRVNRVRGYASSTQLGESPNDKIRVNGVRGYASTQLMESHHNKITSMFGHPNQSLLNEDFQLFVKLIPILTSEGVWAPQIVEQWQAAASMIAPVYFQDLIDFVRENRNK